jgi:hypothetical protein
MIGKVAVTRILPLIFVSVAVVFSTACGGISSQEEPASNQLIPVRVIVMDV